MEYDVQALSIEETRRRKSLSDEARNMVKQSLTIEEEDDTGLMMIFLFADILFRAASVDGHLSGALSGAEYLDPR